MADLTLHILMIGILVMYTLGLLFLFLYSISQAYLVFKYIWAKKNSSQLSPAMQESDLPPVTIQLPVYNEKYVIERLIDAAVNMEYPAGKKQIQVLDDSTDETTSLIADKVKKYQHDGIDIVQVRRSVRTGFKAGALKEGLANATGEFMAIFDADFVPPRDFLLKALPHFSNENIGMVQTRWEHLNRKYSLLTDLQAFGLDAHFRVEQVGRNTAGCFMNFNGTGGVWRKQCIIDAGNWEADTLTEDLDLSYRAQLKGWKFTYLEDVASPAELPPVMSALKSQQYRWTKGGAETAKKHLKHVFKSKLPLLVKWQAVAHLLNSAVFVSIILCALLSVPVLFIRQQWPQLAIFYKSGYVFIFSFITISASYFVTCLFNSTKKWKSVWYFIKTFPLFLAMSMGLSLHHAIAVIEGYAGKKTPFIRTPKFNLGSGDKSLKNNYSTNSFNLISILEGCIALYFVAAIFYGITLHDYGLVAFHTMLAIGFTMVFYYSLLQLSSPFSNKLKTKPAA
ncbi:MAG: cellulose synthase family protein [Ginsengibacter sp.]